MSHFSLALFPIWVWVAGTLILFALSFVFWFVWTICEIGRKYFDFLPERLQAPGFWAVLGILICVSILGNLVFG